jgi:CheY-like chemotaxis protein
VREVPPPRTDGNKRVLIADDNLDSAESLALLLRSFGNTVATAHDGLQAVAEAERFRPDAILLDLGMPKLDGCGAAVRIREQPWGRAMFLVALTGWGQDEFRGRTRRAGFDAHLVKPVDLPALMALLAKVPAAIHAG